MYIGFEIVSGPEGILWSNVQVTDSGEDLDEICQSVSKNSVVNGLGRDSSALFAVYKFPLYKQFMEQPSTLYITYSAGPNIYGILNTDEEGTPEEILHRNLRS